MYHLNQQGRSNEMGRITRESDEFLKQEEEEFERHRSEYKYDEDTYMYWEQSHENLSTSFVQTSPIAGFQHCLGEEVWDSLRVGHAMTLVREPDNPHDQKAVEVLWMDQMIGYLPRTENAEVARLLDRGVRLQTRIIRLKDSPDPCDRVHMEIRTVIRQPSLFSEEDQVRDKECIAEKFLEYERLAEEFQEEELQSAIEAKAGVVILPRT
jgi:hypothetical protein